MARDVTRGRGAILPDPPSPKVFISYAHESDEHAEAVRTLWTLLRENGVDAKIDLVAEASGRVDWPLWMEDMVRWAEHVLVIASNAYCKRAEGRADPGEGRGVGWEARLIREEFYKNQRDLDRFVPVLLPGHSTDELPDFLAPHSSTVYTLREFTVAGAEPLFRLLTRQPLEIEPKPGKRPLLPPRGPVLAGAAARVVARRAKSSDLLDADIVRAVRAADELAGNPELDVSALLNVNRASEATRRIARTLLATVPDRSGPPLLELIMACEVTGPAWRRASDAADLLSPTHCSLVEDDLTKALKRGVERSRHVITALGRIGATPRAEIVVEEAELYFDKLGSYASEALARMFQASMATGSTGPTGTTVRDAAARTLGDFLSRHAAESRYDVYSVFYTLTPPHADPLLKHWLTSKDAILVSLAAAALGHMRLRRACRAIADRAGNMAVKDAAPLFSAIGRIGGNDAVELLRTRSRLPEYGRVASEGLALCAEYVEEDFDRLARELIDSTSANTWAVYRAIGMRPDPGLDELLHRGLLDDESADRGVAVLALARRQGGAVLDTVKTAFEQATGPVESIMAALALLRLDDTSITRSMINDQLVGAADTVLHIDDLLFNDVISELELGDDPRLTDLAYAFRWLRLRP